MNRSDVEEPRDEVGAALAALPRETAGEHFTRSVLARLDEPGTTAAPRWLATRRAGLWACAAAAAAAVVLLVGVALERGADERLDSEELARVEQLRERHERLLEEIALLEGLAERARPVVRIPGESADYLLDVRALRPVTESRGYRPVAYRRFD